MLKLIYTFTAALFISTPGFAYLGPGVGGGFILATLGVILALIIGLFAILFYPIKRLIKKIKKKDITKHEDDKIN